MGGVIGLVLLGVCSSCAWPWHSCCWCY